MSKYVDFDKFFKEKKGEKISFKMFGDVYKLPSSMPAMLMLELIRGEKEDELSAEAVFKMMSALLGEKNFNKLVDKGLTIDQMEDVITWVAEQYGVPVNDSEEEAGNFPEEK